MSLTRKIAQRFANYGDAGSLGSRLRAKRLAPLLAMIDHTFAENGRVRVIDVGGTDTYWTIIPRDYLEARRVEVTIVNLPGEVPREDFGPFRFATGDGCRLAEFGDASFDIAHSNSVIEHVGDWDRMVQFAREITRLAPRYFVQTPNYWFPVEPHCMTPLIHWLPKPMRIWLVRHFQLGHWKKAISVDEAVRLVESARLLNRKMMQELFKEARVVTERFFLLPKSLIAVRVPEHAR